jgi:hypothetical protein
MEWLLAAAKQTEVERALWDVQSADEWLAVLIPHTATSMTQTLHLYILL